jgi:hypothetical protein
MQCRDFESVLEREGFGVLPLAARSHLAECPACQSLVTDLSTVVSIAKEFPSEINPPERLWVSLRAHLEAEGLIRQPRVAVVENTAWWQGLAIFFKPRVLVSAGVGIALALTAFLTIHKGPVSVTETSTPGTSVAQVPPPQQPKAALPSSPAPRVSAPASQLATSVTPRSSPVPAKSQPLKPSPTDIIYPGSPAGTGVAPQDSRVSAIRGSVEADATLNENLKVINQVIAECKKHLKKYPNDSMAQEYLASATRQREELLAALLDSGRSEQ